MYGNRLPDIMVVCVFDISYNTIQQTPLALHFEWRTHFESKSSSKIKNFLFHRFMFDSLWFWISNTLYLFKSPKVEASFSNFVFSKDRDVQVAAGLLILPHFLQVQLDIQQLKFLQLVSWILQQPLFFKVPFFHKSSYVF